MGKRLDAGEDFYGFCGDDSTETKALVTGQIADICKKAAEVGIHADLDDRLFRFEKFIHQSLCVIPEKADPMFVPAGLSVGLVSMADPWEK